ncbi:carboxypeptidase regulatory-like domain-containing protein (plasmid) [Legionella sp. D16C41]|uniref:carboxypeptidase regulatory-like domain-containing protein n=1 Tax=Legionella sp. D16C41 TaxID=3402688 RepID=UPI003AF90319
MKDKNTVLISGFARSFISNKPLTDATITVLENAELKFKTDLTGKFGPFEWPVGQPITLVCEKPGSFWSGFKTTQTATLIVPPEGINNDDFLKNISFQVPSNIAYKFFALAMGIKEDPTAGQIAATITPPNMTLDDLPQGIAGVTVTLSPATKTKPFYFGILPVTHKTNPFSRRLNYTSLDGGVAFANVPPGDYIMEAKKGDISFSKVTFKARAGILTNASPPHGPTVLKDSN